MDRLVDTELVCIESMPNEQILARNTAVRRHLLIEILGFYGHFLGLLVHILVFLIRHSERSQPRVLIVGPFV